MEDNKTKVVVWLAWWLFFFVLVFLGFLLGLLLWHVVFSTNVSSC
jgi:hypothetical protein